MKAFRPFLAEYRALVLRLRQEGFRVRWTSIMAPVQLEGHLPSGEAFYFRCRWDTCRLDVAPARQDPVRHPTWTQSISRWGQYEASGLDAAEAETALRELLSAYTDYRRVDRPEHGGEQP
ncbi:MAG: hypothetical protein U0556_00015 [Dehalococcoidia bacterium]